MAKKVAPPTPLGQGMWTADEWPFVREIHAQPFDDAPRLIFADWLEERGDPRAEFIRVQCRLAAMRGRDAGHDDLEDRRGEILARCQPAWTRVLPKLPDVSWGIVDSLGSEGCFCRGMPEAVNARKGKSLLGNPALFHELGVRAFEIKVTSNRAVEQLAHLPQLSAVGSLRLDGSGLDGDLSPILEAPQLGPLECLELYASAARGLQAFLAGPHAGRLRSLMVHWQDSQVVIDWPQAAQLDAFVHICPIWDRGDRTRYDPADAPSLETQGALIELLSQARMRPSIVALSGDSRALPSFFRCAQGPAWSELVILALATNHGNRGVFAELKLPPHVTTLYIELTCARSGRGFVQALAGAESLRQVETLGLTGAPLSDADAKTLARAKVWDRLRKLDLAGAGVGEAGALALVDSASMPRLERLRLSRSRISAEVRARLRRRFRGRITF